MKKLQKLQPVESERSGALPRGLSILREMLSAPQPLTLGEIANLAKLDQSTTSRLLRSLESVGFVVRLEDRKRYAPAPQAAFPLPFLHPLDRLRREIQPILEHSLTTFGDTAVLILYVGTRRMVVDIAHKGGSPVSDSSNWGEGPLHATSSGKALLAGFTSAERRAALGPEPYSAETGKTITDFATLNAQIELAAERGYASAQDEQLTGLTAIAANISVRAGSSIGCLCIMGHSRDFPQPRIDALGTELVQAAKLLPHQVLSLRAAAQFLGRA